MLTTAVLPKNPNLVVLLVGGCAVAVLTHDEVASLRLGTKTRWTVALQQRAAALLARRKARESAMRLLARKAHTRDELERGLRRLRLPPACVSEALDALTRDGWIDDAQCAASRVAQWERTSTGHRPRTAAWMISRLVAAGIDVEVAESTVSRGMSAATERRSAEQALQTALRGGKSVRAALAALSRRGFSQELLEELAAAHDERDDG